VSDFTSDSDEFCERLERKIEMAEREPRPSRIAELRPLEGYPLHGIALEDQDGGEDVDEDKDFVPHRMPKHIRKRPRPLDPFFRRTEWLKRVSATTYELSDRGGFN